MQNINLEEIIKNNSSELTTKYAIKILEQAKLFIETQYPKNELEKFCLLKTISMNIGFACELLLKTRIHNYNNGNDYSTWKTHNLLDIFNFLSQHDKTFVCNKLNITELELNQILQDNATSNAYEKRYLYEETTGIPNYEILCKLANSLLELNNQNITFELYTIDTLYPNFNTTQFSFEEIIKIHSQMIYDKSQIFNLELINDEIEEYLVQNIKSCDFALFSELRYKYFDVNQNPKKKHEFNILHKNLEEACKFLVTKGRYMDAYMSSTSTIDFYWALESLMFTENFNAGDTVKDLYADVNTTFENSRFCTTKYYNNYYNASTFVETIKSITDLLMMNKEKANKILKNKNDLISEFGIQLLQFKGFTADEMETIDIEYLKELNKKVQIENIPKKLLLESEQLIRDKIFFFLESDYKYRYNMPTCIDQIITLKDDGYNIDEEKLNAYSNLTKRYIYINNQIIEQYVELAKEIENPDLIIHIILKKYNIKDSINKYKQIINKCSQIMNNSREMKEFLGNFGEYLIDNECNDKIAKIFILENSFKQQEFYSSIHNKYEKVNTITHLANYEYENIIKRFSLFKLHKLEKLLFINPEPAMEMDINELSKKLKQINKNIDILKPYYYDEEILNIDIYELVEFLKETNKESNSHIFSLSYISSGKANEIYNLLKDKNMLFLYTNDMQVETIENNEILEAISNKNIIKDMSHNYDEEDKLGLQILVQETFKNQHISNVLLDLFDLKIINDYPKVLKLFYNPYSTLENVYRLNIYNNWYNKIQTNTIKPNGSPINLSIQKRTDITRLFIEELTKTYNNIGQNELSNRLEFIFGNVQLINSLNEDILSKYKIHFMKQIMDDCKFKNQDFQNYNFYGNLFETIHSNRISVDQFVKLLNKLHDYKKNTSIIDFVQKICKCQKQNSFSLTTLNIDGTEYKFDDCSIEKISNELLNKNEQETIDYINKIIIKKEDISEYNTTYPEIFDETYEEKRNLGLEVFQNLKEKLFQKIVLTRNKGIDIITTSYIANKIKIYQLTKEQRELEKKEDGCYGRKK